MIKRNCIVVVELAHNEVHVGTRELGADHQRSDPTYSKEEKADDQVHEADLFVIDGGQEVEPEWLAFGAPLLRGSDGDTHLISKGPASEPARLVSGSGAPASSTG
jgi:hypothetical protein